MHRWFEGDHPPAHSLPHRHTDKLVCDFCHRVIVVYLTMLLCRIDSVQIYCVCFCLGVGCFTGPYLAYTNQLFLSSSSSVYHLALIHLSPSHDGLLLNAQLIQNLQLLT